MTIRRLVTGHDSAGKAVFASDTLVDAEIVPGFGSQFTRLWGADAPQSLPDDGHVPDYRTYFPPRAGYRFGIFTVPPARATELTEEELILALRRMEELFPGAIEHIEPSNPGMHTSDSVDFGYVISGSVWLELDDGAERELRAGDTYIQNGTRHAWHNRNLQPCTILIVLIGTERNPTGIQVAQSSASALDSRR